MIHPDLDDTSQVTFTWKQRVALAVYPPLLAWFFRALYATCRIEVRGKEHWDAVSDSGAHFLLAFWHESLAIAARYYLGTGFHGLTSYGFDGELAARFLRQYGLGAIRGSSSRGGMKALVQLKKATERIQMIGLTVDGPRGPRREAKPGLAMVAAKRKLPILPQAFVPASAWRLRSWDRLPIPKPFTRIVCLYGPPIPPPEEPTREGIEATRLRVEIELNRLSNELEAELGVDACLET